MLVQPYLFFDGRCEEAVEFYKGALGAEVTMLMRFKDNPEPQANPTGAEDKVMHTSFRIGDTTVMASDGRCQGRPSFQGFALSLTAPNDAEAERLFAALAEGDGRSFRRRLRSRYDLLTPRTARSPSMTRRSDRRPFRSAG